MSYQPEHQAEEGLVFRPHMFGAFDTFKCPLQLRKAMTKKAAVGDAGSAVPNLEQSLSNMTISKRTTSRGEEFERSVIALLRNAHGEGSVPDCQSIARRQSGADRNNSVLLDCLRQCAGLPVGGKLYLDQLELHPPRSFTALSAVTDEANPVRFSMMKPDVLVLEKHANGIVCITVVDIKSSAAIKRSHRLQVAVYAEVVEHLLQHTWGPDSAIAIPVVTINPNGEVWLPTSFQSIVDNTAAFNESVRVERFDLAESRLQLRDFFAHIMPLVCRRSETDVPWEFSTTYNGCSRCDFRSACAQRCVDIEDSAMCLGFKPKTDSAAVPILQGVPTVLPTQRVTLGHIANAAATPLTHLKRMASAKRDALAEKRCIAYDYVHHCNGPPPVLPGSLTRKDGDFFDKAAACILYCEPTTHAFVSGIVWGRREQRGGATNSLAEFLTQLNLVEASTLIMWSASQINQLQTLLFSAASSSTTPTTAATHAKALLLKFFDGVDSRFLANWMPDGENLLPHRLHSPTDAVVNVTQFIADNIAIPLPGRAWSLTEVAAAFNVAPRSGTWPTISSSYFVEDMLLDSSSSALVAANLLIDVLEKALVLSPPSRSLPNGEVIKLLSPPSRPVPTANQLLGFHAAVAVAECHNSQRFRGGSSAAPSSVFYRLQFDPDTSKPSMCRFKILPPIDPSLQWEFSKDGCRDYMLRAHATFSGEAKLTLNQLNYILKKASKEFDFNYCDAAKSQGKALLTKGSAEFSSVEGRWYFRPRSASSASPWGLMESLKPLAEELGFLSLPYVLMSVNKKVVRSGGLDGFDDLAGYSKLGGWSKETCDCVDVVASDLLDEESPNPAVFVYLNIGKEFLSGGRPGSNFYLAPRACNFNFSRVLPALASLDEARDPLLVHCVSGRRGTKVLSPLNLNIDTQMHTSQGKNKLSADQRAFMECVRTNPLSVLWGPPGTGKTFTLACLLRLLLGEPPSSGKEPVVALVVAFTHKALEEIRSSLKDLAPHEDIPYRETRWEDVNKDEKCFTAEYGGNVVAFTTVWGATKNYKKKGGIFVPSLGRQCDFNFLLVDEASQLPVCDALVASQAAAPNARIVLAGDIMQLTPILPPSAASSRAARAHPHRALLTGSVLEAVLFSNKDPNQRLNGLDLVNPNGGVAIQGIIPTYVTQLTTSYRSAVPEIVSFVGRLYPKYLPHPAGGSNRGICRRPLELHLLNGDSALSEIKCAYPIIKQVLMDHHSLGIVTPHRRQRVEFTLVVKRIKRELEESLLVDATEEGSPLDQTTDSAMFASNAFSATNATNNDASPGDGSDNEREFQMDWPSVRVDTAERMQGQQFDVVIVALADVKIGFTYNLNRLNVALSRARHALIVISSDEVMRPTAETLSTLIQQGARDKGIPLEESKAAVEAAAGHLQAFQRAAEVVRAGV